MRHLFLALHLLFAVFAIGPLVGAASVAARGVKAGDAVAVAGSARTVRIYGYLSILVAVFGLAMVQPKWHAQFSYPWVWISLVLFVIALALTLAVLEPGLRGAAQALGQGNDASGFAGRVAASGGLIALIYAVIIVLMVYRPH